MADDPKTANQLVDSVYVSTKTTHIGNDLNTSEGLREAVKANAAAIRLLADHIDGVKVDAKTGERVDKSGKPV